MDGWCTGNGDGSPVVGTTHPLPSEGGWNDDALVLTELADSIKDSWVLVHAALTSSGCEGGEACEGEDVGELHIGLWCMNVV